MELNQTDGKVAITDKPFYKRSEFWVSLVTSLVGLFASSHSNDESLKTVGGIAAAASPLVYTFGRAQIKKTLVTGLVSAFANAVQAPGPDDKSK